MPPKIVQLDKKLLVGQSVQMSLVDNKTSQLWKKFKNQSNEVANRISEDFFSLQVYPNDYFKKYDPKRKFQKWAAVEVSNFDNLSATMETLTLVNGLYAVFHYKGSSSDPTIFQYIYCQWLPLSGYELEDRPHFEVLGKRYKNNDPNSEEKIWIPIKQV